MLADGPSDWTIPSSSSKDYQNETKKERNNDVDEDGVRYLWETLLYFLVPVLLVSRGEVVTVVVVGTNGMELDG